MEAVADHAAPGAARSHALKKWTLIALAAIGFWLTIIVIVISYRILADDRTYAAKMLPFDGTLILFAASFSLGLRAAAERLTGLAFGTQMLAAGALIALVVGPFEIAFRALLVVIAGDPPLSAIGARRLFSASLFWLAPFSLWTLGNLALLHNQAARRNERRLAEARIEAHAAQVRALRYQINPHFLYNTLNSIAALILDQRPAEAEAMVIRLSAFFRAGLSIDPFDDVPLRQEIEHQLLYLDIEKVRFADALSVEVDVPPHLAEAGVPSLILQPLVENALKHGYRGPGRPMRLGISARGEGDMLTIEVADDGRGAAAAAPGTGTGLSNVERRLASRFPGRSRVEASSRADGFTVRLTMPLGQSA